MNRANIHKNMDTSVVSAFTYAQKLLSIYYGQAF